MVFEEVFEEIEDLPVEMRQLMHKMSEEDYKLQDVRFQALKIKHKLFRDKRTPYELYSATDIDEADDEFMSLRNRVGTNGSESPVRKKHQKGIPLNQEDVKNELKGLYSDGRDAISQKIYDGDYAKDLASKPPICFYFHHVWYL